MDNKNLNPLAGLGDTIIDIQLVPSDGGYIFKITRKSCKTGYITTKGISNSIENALSISGARTITLDTFLELENYKFTTEPLYINVLVDEDKGQENTSYSWTGSVLKWNAEVVDDYQPVIN